MCSLLLYISDTVQVQEKAGHLCIQEPQLSTIPVQPVWKGMKESAAKFLCSLWGRAFFL